jgi:hypothetical protein
MKIGITCADESKVWNNGLHQNAYNLYKLYQKLNFNVFLVSQKKEYTKVFEDNIVFLDSETIKKFDVILEVSESLTDSNYSIFIKNNKKVISINYGNLLMVFNEHIIADKKQAFCFSRENVENWYSPHFYFSEGLTRVTSKKEGKICPYIWSPDFLVKYSSKNNFDIFKAAENLDPSKLAMLEPNLNFMKSCIYPIIGCEILENRDSKKISQIMTFGTDNIKDSKSFIEMIKKFEIFKTKKISFENRYSYPYLIKSGHIGTVVSNNIYNDLNYLTLESLFLNIPIVHNSKFCKEAGYYYESPFDGIGISNQIENAIDNFNYNKKIYSESAKEVIWKFSPENPDNIKTYKEILESAM